MILTDAPGDGVPLEARPRPGEPHAAQPAVDLLVTPAAGCDLGARVGQLVARPVAVRELGRADVRARIRKTAAFAESVPEAQYAGAAQRTVALSWAGGKTLAAENYLLQITIPNAFFHIAMAYAILRHNGVDVGKRDFLGPINFVDA